MQTKIENIPKEIRLLKQWVCWAGADKIPKNPYTGGNAKSNDPSTWAGFKEACDACEKYHFDGIGFMFANGYFGVDLDHCADNSDFVDEFVETLQSYAEYSKSGDGVHIICRGTLPNGARRHGNVEMYSSGRYFICTGNLYSQKYTEIRDCTESVKVLHGKYLPSKTPKFSAALSGTRMSLDDQQVIDKARNSRTGQLFNLLYSGNWQGAYRSQSEADIAFCNQLAFWCGKDEAQMDRIFRSSGLMREKWDKRRGDMTYGAMTISKACAACVDVYDPVRYDDSTELAVAFFKDGKVGVSKKKYDMTDTGNAHRFNDCFGNIIRYSYNRKKWYYWDGKVWRLDDSGEIKKLADIVCEDIKRDAFMETDEKTQMDMLKWANRTAQSRGKESMIHECQHLDRVPVGVDEFDAYTDYINCQNGIVNLRNGELIPHDSNFMMSKMTNCEYDVSGKPPKLWLSFLNDVTGGNKDLQRYIQKSIGYSITGSGEEQCAYFLYGVGNNGKSTFLDTISDMLGGYASNAQPETLMMKRFGTEGAGGDIARLKSARFVTTEEPTEGVRLNEGLLKQLTGGSRVTCRFLYGEEFEYTPEFKIWMATNHKPVIRGTDAGIWRRIKLIPFEVTIPKEKVDKNLKYKLREEFPRILRWAVEGCMMWRKEGIEDPTQVQEAVKEYKQEMDLLAGFIEQCIEIDYSSKDKIYAPDMFKAYIKWAKENNEYEMSSKKFHSEISKRLPEKGRSGKGVYYKNVRFTDGVKSSLRNYSINDFYSA